MKKVNVKLREEIFIYYFLILELSEKIENSLTYEQIRNLFILCFEPYEVIIKNYIYNLYRNDKHFYNIFNEAKSLLDDFDEKGKHIFPSYKRSEIKKGKIIKGKEDDKIYKLFINKKKEINKYLINIDNINKYLEDASTLDSNYIYQFFKRFLEVLQEESKKYKNINNQKIEGYSKNKKILEDKAKKQLKKEKEKRDKHKGFNLFNWK